MIKKLLFIFTCVISMAANADGPFVAGQVLQAAQLNAALAAPTITGGSINGAPIGASNPRSGIFTTLKAGTNPSLSGQTFNVGQNSTGATDYATGHVVRTTSHSGGTPGYVNSALRIDHNVGAGVTNYEWGLTSVMNNSATGGENVALYGQGNRQTTTTGPTWAGVLEAREVVPITNPSTGLIGLEVDNRSNGTDSNTSRIGVDVVGTRYNLSGVATELSYGYRVQTNRDLLSTVKIGYGFDTINTKVGVGFDTSGATITGAAYRMASGQPIAFDAASSLTLKGETGVFVFGGGPASLSSSSSYLSVGGGNGFIYGNISGISLPGNSTSSGVALTGWNRSSGGGEMNFVNAKGAGSAGGFDWRIWNGSADTKVAGLDASGNFSGNTFASTVATGTAPFTVSSTTPVANLSIGGNAANSSRLLGSTWASPPAIGATAPNSAAFTTATITDAGNSTNTLTITNTGANGASIRLNGNGGTTPTKYIRANGGVLQIVNSAFSAVPLSLDDSGNLTVTGAVSHAKQEIDLSYTYNTPTTGQTVTIASGTQTAIINPAGTLAALTITLPACNSGYNGSLVRYTSEQVITALTVNASSGSVSGAPTNLAIGAGNGYICRGSDTTWYRLY